MTSFPDQSTEIQTKPIPSFPKAMNSHRAGFFIAEPTGLILKANDTFLLMIGASQGELDQGLLFCRDLMTSGACLQLEQALEHLEARGYIEPFEIEFCTQQGCSFSGMVSITALMDGSGCGAYWVHEVSGNTHAFSIPEGIFDEMTHKIAAIDMQWRYSAFNEAYRLEVNRSIGHEIKVGDNVLDSLVNAPQHLALASRLWKRALSGEAFVVIEELGCTEGEQHYFEITFKPLFNRGQQIGAYHIARDITIERRLQIEREQSQTEIIRLNQELQRLFDVTFEQAAVGLAQVGSHGEFLRINQKYCEIVGYSKEEMSKITFDMITHPDERERDLLLQQRIVSRDLDHISQDKRYIRKDGSTIWVHLTVSAVVDAQGHVDFNLGVVEDITERKQAEEALRESEARFRILANASPTQIFDMAPDGKLRFINQTAINFYGAEHEQEIHVGDWAKFVYPEDREKLVHAMQYALESHTGFMLETRLLNKDGDYCWFITFTAPSFYPNGDFYGLVGSNVDITERKQAELAVRESEERFRIMANASPLQIYDVAPNGKLRFVNQTTLDFYGPEKEQEILDGGWVNYLHPEDRERMDQPMASAAEVKDFSIAEFRLKRKDGKYRWVITYTAPSYYPNGDFYGLVGSAIDITERKEMEEALQKSEARWRELANVVPLILWVANAQGEVSFVNDRWYQYSGLTPEQSLGTAGVEAVHPEDREAAVAHWADYMQRGELFESEVRYRSAGGSYRWFLVRAVPVKDADGTVLNWYGTNVDIQDRRVMEQELAKARDTAEDANKKKSQFLANMSHELRTPLNAVIGFSDMLKKGMAGSLSDKQTDYVEHIATSGRHLLTMVNDILDISKAEAGRIDVYLQYVELEPLIQQLKEITSFSAGKKQVQVSFEVQPGLVGIVADPDRLKQIFLNLLSNAIKFNYDGGRVDVFLSISPDNQWVVCAIQDTGIGIPANKIDKLFSEFYQVDNSNTRRYEGTGLGLALTKQLVELHHGQILVESQEGAGSVFTFKLPLNPYAKPINPEEPNKISG